MTNKDDKRPTVNVENEMRTEGTSKMIGEGGIGAEKYYDIKKEVSSDDKITEDEKEDK